MASHIRLLDLEFFSQVAAGDIETMCMVADIFINTQAETLSDLKAAVASAETSTIASLAHRLASPLGAFGAKAALELAKQLEATAAAQELDRIPHLFQSLDQLVRQLSLELQEFITAKSA